LRLTLTPALALAAMLPLASAAQAGERDAPIVVTSPEKMKAWQADTTRTLNRAIDCAVRRDASRPAAGIVQLTFDMGADGKPENVKLLSHSSNWTGVNSAKAAVRRLDVSEVPVTNAGSARFLANIIFASDAAQHRELAQELARAERARMAAGGEDLILLGG
jgi:hypothetical protein